MTNTSQLDQLSSLLEQESLAYRTSDYLRKPQTQQESVLSENLSISQIHGSKKRKLLPSTSPRAVGNDKSFIIERPLMNHEWRLKMVEWTYRGELSAKYTRNIIINSEIQHHTHLTPPHLFPFYTNDPQQSLIIFVWTEKSFQ
jgi:hypothetical protein